MTRYATLLQHQIHPQGRGPTVPLLLLLCFLLRQGLLLWLLVLFALFEPFLMLLLLLQWFMLLLQLRGDYRHQNAQCIMPWGLM
jgi:hypothetical protein